MTTGAARLYTLEDPPFQGATGQGIRIAMIDSGAAAGHPHVGDLYGGVHILPEGEGGDFADRIGHGTAVAGAIREKAPNAELLAVRVFDRELVTTASVLARAIEWATESGAHLINVSLGTPNDAHAERLTRAVRLAEEAGVIVIAAATSGGERMWPGALPGVVGVAADWEGPRNVLRAEGRSDGGLLLWTSAFPRPIPGIPRDRNLKGVSFAVANATGFLARLRELSPTVSATAQVRDALLSG